MKRAVGVGIVIIAFAFSACTSSSPDGAVTGAPSQYLYRAVIEDCRITVPQLATVFRIDETTLLSAAHPFEGIASFELTDEGGLPIPADIVSLVPEKDIAVLKLRAPVDGPGIELANAEVEAGTSVVIPTFDRDGAIELNAAFVLRRAQVTLEGEDERRSLELEGDIRAGDSGAPVVEENRAVGIVFASTRGAKAGWAVSLPEIEQVLAAAESGPLTLGCTGEE